MMTKMMMTSTIRMMTKNKGGPAWALGRRHDELPAVKSAASSFTRILTTGIPTENPGAASVNRARGGAVRASRGRDTSTLSSREADWRWHAGEDTPFKRRRSVSNALGRGAW